MLFIVHCAIEWFQYLDHSSCVFKLPFRYIQVTLQNTSTEVGEISLLLWRQVIKCWLGAHKPHDSHYGLSQSAGQVVLNKILPFFLQTLSFSNQTQPGCSERSICESKVLNNLTAKPLTKPNLGLPYPNSIVISTFKIQTAREHPKFAIVLRWSCPNISIYKFLKEDWKII